jgi:protein-S-isoprenylcysteine O-methyltransferase Ste14
MLPQTMCWTKHSSISEPWRDWLIDWLATAFLAICALPFLFYRTIAEDRMLLTQLPGYRDYAARVRWRLLPGLW